jgi:hypothetical protein
VKRSTAACLLALLAGAALPACGGGKGLTAPTDPVAGQSRSAAPSDPPAPGFRDSSGVTDIPAFGSEAAVTDRLAVTRALTAYLQAAVGKEWGRACARLPASTAVQLRRLTIKLRRVAHKSCEEGLRLSLSSLASGKALYYGPADVAALRIKRGGGAGEAAGFALFHGNDGDDYWVTVRLEGGKWKVSSLAPQPLR